MTANRERPAGFDYMRIALASLVFLYHGLGVDLRGSESEMGGFLIAGGGRIILHSLVPMFFALGGYLVAGSLERSKSLVTFLLLRAIRIFPPLWADVLFSALVLGPLLTTHTLARYFSSPTFAAYLLNLVGYMHYMLPGVFDHNPVHTMNAQLWTVPLELRCIMAMALLAGLGLYRNRAAFLCVAVAVQILVPAYMQGGPARSVTVQ